MGKKVTELVGQGSIINGAYAVLFHVTVPLKGLARLSIRVSLRALNKCLFNDLKSYWPYLGYINKANTRSLQYCTLKHVVLFLSATFL